MARNAREYAIHKAVCDYLRLRYPCLLFNSDMSGLNLSQAQAGQAKMLRSDRGYPDLVLYEPRGRFYGLFLELKKEGTTIVKKNGEMVADEHIREQAKIIMRLNAIGYKARFAIGLDDALQAIDDYMKIK